MCPCTCRARSRSPTPLVLWTRDPHRRACCRPRREMRSPTARGRPFQREFRRCRQASRRSSRGVPTTGRAPRPDAETGGAMLKLAVVSLVLLLSIPLVWAQSRVDSDYVQGFKLWQVRNYPDASTTLIRYRTSKRYAQTYDVDYWLGTSWCRITGSERAGVDILDWGYGFSQMPPSAREQYRVERDACQQFLRQPTTARLLPGTIITAAL